MWKTLLKISIKLAMIVVGVLGIVFSASSTSFMANGYVFMFFTVQSTITIMAISLVFLINDVLVLFKKDSFVGQKLYLTKYAFTVAITITFLVFFAVLAPTLGIDYLLSFNNFSLHLIVPVLALIDFFIFDMDIDLSYKNSLLGCLMPLYYVVFFLIGIPLGFRYTDTGLKAPYFFLNYEEIGWFQITSKGPGVIVYILGMMVLIVGLCFLFTLLMKLRKGELKKDN